MSYRPHTTKSGHWFILKETKVPDPKRPGKFKRQQKYIAFEGSEAEAAAMDAVINNKEIPTSYPTVLDVIPRFLSAYQNNTQGNTYAAMNNALKHILPFYGELRIPLLMDHHHEKYKALRLSQTYLPGKHGQSIADDGEGETDRRRTVSKSSINREIACIRAFLTYARDKEKISVGAWPDPFPKRQAAGKKIVPLAPSEMEAILKAASKVLTSRNPILDGKPRPQGITVHLMMLAGLRLKEATMMRVEKIALKNSTMHVVGKGGDEQAIGIIRTLSPILAAAIGDRHEGYLVTNHRNNNEPFQDIDKTLNGFAREAGITRKINHHMLRHSCATAMILAGHTVPFVQAYLRHVDSKTTMEYVHIAARFGDLREKEIACRMFPTSAVETIEKKTGVLGVLEMSSHGAIRADSQTRRHHS